MAGGAIGGLDALERALAQRLASREALLAAFNGLTVPGDVGADALGRLYAACYVLLSPGGAGAGGGNPVTAPNPGEALHLRECARETVEQTLYDRNADSRTWIREMHALFTARGEPVPDELEEATLPPEIAVPWDGATAGRQLAPFLAYYEHLIDREPVIHFRLCWNIARHGYPVFREVVFGWARGLEAGGRAFPGTVEAMATAQDLAARADGGHPLPWRACADTVLPLLDDRHPMVAAGAARLLGALYGEGGMAGDRDAPALGEILTGLAARELHRAAICGGFVNGFDTDSAGLGALAGIEHGRGAGFFDTEAWVFDVLRGAPREVYLPNAQSFWFYVHEHFAARPAAVSRLIDIGQPWLAMMCACEIAGAVEGMGPALERLARDSDEAVALAARTHLGRFYA